MTTRINASAIELLRKGLIVIPLIPDTKRPVQLLESKISWSDLNINHIPKLIEMWSRLHNPQLNMAVVCNTNIVCIDFDKRNKDHWKFLRQNFDTLKLTKPYIQKTPSGGYHFWYRTNIPIKSRKLKEYEVIGSRAYALVAPSRIKNTPYVQCTKQPLNPILLPIIPSWIEERLNDLNESKVINKDYSVPSNITPEEIQLLLEQVPSDDYDTWIKVGMALKTYQKTNSIKMFDVWDEWSKKSLKYETEELCKQKWESFGKGDTTIDVGTLIYFAGEYGGDITIVKAKQLDQFANSGFADETANIDTDASFTEEDIEHLKRQNKLALQNLSTSDKIGALLRKTDNNIYKLDSDTFFNRCPNKFGAIFRQLLKDARHKQPSILFGSLLAAVSHLKATSHICTDMGWYCTNYIACFAPTSSGKNYGKTLMLNALEEAGSFHNTIEEFASTQTLIARIAMSSTKTLFQLTDEASGFFTLPNEKTPAHLEKSIDVITKLWSKGNDSYISSGTLTNKFKDAYTIKNPKLNILTLSQPATLENLSGTSLLTRGFLPRFLICVDTRHNVDKSKPHSNTPPAYLIEYFKDLTPKVNEAIFTEEDVEYESEQKEEKVVEAKEPTHVFQRVDVPIDSDALQYYIRYMESREDLLATMDDTNPRKAIIGKSAELVGRIALAISDDRITRQTIMWCCNLIERQVDMIALFIDNLNVNRWERARQMDEDVVVRKVAGWYDQYGRAVTKTQLHSTLASIRIRCGGGAKFYQMLNDLQDMGKITIVKEGKRHCVYPFDSETTEKLLRKRKQKEVDI